METNRQPLPQSSKFADAHKAWACFLVGLIVSLFVFRNNLPLEAVAMCCAVLGAFYATKAVLHGPLRMVGGIFLVLNGCLLIGAIMA